MTEKLSQAQALKWLQLPAGIARVDGDRFIVEGESLMQKLAKQGITSVTNVIDSGLANPRTQAGNSNVLAAISFDKEALENFAGITYAEAQGLSQGAAVAAIG